MKHPDNSSYNDFLTNVVLFYFIKQIFYLYNCINYALIINFNSFEFSGLSEIIL
jgi:hypothetical protein